MMYTLLYTMCLAWTLESTIWIGVVCFVVGNYYVLVCSVNYIPAHWWCSMCSWWGNMAVKWIIINTCQTKHPGLVEFYVLLFTGSGHNASFFLFCLLGVLCAIDPIHSTWTRDTSWISVCYCSYFFHEEMLLDCFWINSRNSQHNYSLFLNKVLDSCIICHCVYCSSVVHLPLSLNISSWLCPLAIYTSVLFLVRVYIDM